MKDVIAIHTQATYTVAFVGFSPGFAYLSGLNPRLVVSRLASPRRHVPPGAVAIAERTYVAIAGGLGVDATLASRSTDLLSGLGPSALKAGDQIPIGIQTPMSYTRQVESRGTRVPMPIDRDVTTNDPCTLRVIVGPRDDWFRAGALSIFLDALYVVDPASNRIGVGLRGPQISRAGNRELPSEPTIPGAIQIPPNGVPLVFGPGAPVTGGYPVIAVVLDDDLDLLAQCRPGQTIRFAPLR